MKKAVFRGKPATGTPTGVEELDWVYGDLVHELATGMTYILDLAFFKSDTKISELLIEVKPETIGQYTGIDDCNLKRIFTGDVLSLGRIHDSTTGREGKRLYAIVALEHGVFEPVAYFPSSVLEVVGNIHDNPSYLEEAL